jgi:hypothetical protein
MEYYKLLYLFYNIIYNCLTKAIFSLPTNEEKLPATSGIIYILHCDRVGRLKDVYFIAKKFHKLFFVLYIDFLFKIFSIKSLPKVLFYQFYIKTKKITVYVCEHI